MLEPLFVLIGIAGTAFMIYAFTVMRLLNRTARILAISVLILLAILLSNRVFAPSQLRAAPNFFPFGDSSSPSPRAIQGWQETPFIILELILSEISDFDGSPPGSPPTSPLPTSPAPGPSLAPSPVDPTPAPSAPSNIPSPSPTLSPSPVQPAPSPAPPLQPSPDQYPDQYPDRYPDNPYPGNPYPTEPAPSPAPDRPESRPYPQPQQPYPYEPRPTRPEPIPGWW